METCKKGLHQYDTTLKRCPECKKTTQKRLDAARYKDSPEKKKAKNAIWIINNPKKEKARSVTWYKANKEKKKDKSIVWAKDNPEKVKIAQAVYAKANPDKINAKTAKRKAFKLQRTPPWLTKEDYK